MAVTDEPYSASASDPNERGEVKTVPGPAVEAAPTANQDATLIHTFPSAPPTGPVRTAGPFIAGYEVLAELGRGGMGVVYKARQAGLGRLVALKMILAGAHAGTEELARFRREVETIAQLQHPHLVQVYEVGEHEGRPYFSMELMDGCGLDKQIDARPQPPRQAAELVETLARTLHVVHQRGIIHRDLKPANILLTAAGLPKVSDFGLAKRLDAEAGPTLSGDILGTPSYMAPEQATGKLKALSPLTDVYALGAILYELLTGRPPFQAETPLDTVLAVASAEPVAPRRLQPTVPPDLETVCLKCLQKAPGKRYPSADALADDLQRFLKGEPIRARPVGLMERAVKWARRRPAAAALLGVLCLATLALVTGGLVYNARLREAARLAQDHAEQSRRRLVRLQVAQGAHALAAGDWLGALPWFAEALRLDKGHPEQEKMHRLRIATILSQSPRLLRIWFHDGPVRQAQFSADGRRVLTLGADQTARLWDTRSGEPVCPPLRHDAPVLCGALGRNGRAVVTGCKDGTAQVWSAATAQRSTPPLRHGAAVVGVAFSADGRRVLTASADHTARVWDAANGKPLLVPLRHRGAVRCAAFSRDGGRVVTGSDDYTARVWDAHTGEPICLPLKHDGAVTGACFDADGQRVVTASTDGCGRIWSGATGRLLAKPLRYWAAILQASFDPEGRRVLTVNDDHTARIWDARTGELLAPPLRHRSGLKAAAFSPDGQRVVTASDDNTARVWDAASGKLLTPLLRHNGTVHDACFSPRGHLLVTVSHDNTARLWDVAPGRTGPVASTASPAAGAEPGESGAWWSSDRRWKITVEGDHSAAQVRVAKTGKPVGPRLEHGSTIIYAAFSRRGDRLITASDDNTARIWNTRTGRLLTAPLNHEVTVVYGRFSPDGRLVLTVSGQAVRVWDARTGEPITPPLRFNGLCRRAFFAADGSRVNVMGTGQSGWTWDLRGDDRRLDDLLIEAHVLAGSRVDPDQGLLPLELRSLRRAWEQLQSRDSGQRTRGSRRAASGP